MSATDNMEAQVETDLARKLYDKPSICCFTCGDEIDTARERRGLETCARCASVDAHEEER